VEEDLQGLKGLDAFLKDEDHGRPVLQQMIDSLHRVLLSNGPAALLSLTERFNIVQHGNIGTLEAISDEYTAQRAANISHKVAYRLALNELVRHHVLACQHNGARKS
jgi:hypothetical protein